jgi:hypothetical protein
MEIDDDDDDKDDDDVQNSDEYWAIYNEL